MRDNEGGLYLITLLIYTYQNRKTTVLTMIGCLDTWSHYYQPHFRHHCSYTRRVVNPSPRSLVLKCCSNMADMNILKVINGRLVFYSHGRLAFLFLLLYITKDKVDIWVFNATFKILLKHYIYVLRCRSKIIEPRCWRWLENCCLTPNAKVVERYVVWACCKYLVLDIKWRYD